MAIQDMLAYLHLHAHPLPPPSPERHQCISLASTTNHNTTNTACIKEAVANVPTFPQPDSVYINTPLAHPQPSTLHLHNKQYSTRQPTLPPLLPRNQFFQPTTTRHDTTQVYKCNAVMTPLDIAILVFFCLVFLPGCCLLVWWVLRSSDI